MTPMSPLVPVGKVVIIAGAGLILVGILIAILGRTGGRLLPGDIVIQRPGFTLYFPIVTVIAISALLTVIGLLIGLLRR